MEIMGIRNWREFWTACREYGFWWSLRSQFHIWRNMKKFKRERGGL